MPGIRFTKEDLLKKVKLKADWYVAKIKEVTEKTAKSGESNNIIVDWVVTKGEFAGTPIRVWYNEQVPDSLVELLQVMGASEQQLLNTDAIELVRKLVGTELQIFVHYEPNGDFPGNKIDQYRKAAA